MTKNILITGGLGFLGSNLGISLTNDEHNVDIMDITNNHRNIIGYENKFKIYQSDISDVLTWGDIDFSKYDVIYHLAANVSHIKAEKDPYLDVNSNIIGTINLLEAIKELKKKPRFIYACSRSIYGRPITSDYVVDELHPTNPLDSYGISKLAAEKYIQKYSYHCDIPAISFRMANLVGERQGLHTREYQMISWLFRCIAQDEPVGFWGTGLQTRDFLYVGDAVRIYKNAGIGIDMWENQPLFDFYNIGGGEYCTWLSAIQTCAKVLNKTATVKFETYPPERIKLENEHSRLDSTKLVCRFHDIPQTTLSTAFSKMATYYDGKWEDYLHKGIL